VTITGETGTGKTKIARALHMASGANGFVSLECSMITPDGLIHIQKQICGASSLLLRRIEELPEACAAPLTALLDTVPDLRPLVTSSVAVAELDLPRPLFHRLTGSVFAVPPLRQRQDLGWLVERILRRRTAEEVRLSPSARADLLGRSWPGNLRELEQVIDVALAMAEGNVIDLPDLPAPVEERSAESEETLEQIMEACEWNMSRAARRLGVNRSTVLRRLRKAGLHPPS
jgi:transcriptional regulator of acetoin/glycerol metabolism